MFNAIQPSAARAVTTLFAGIDARPLEDQQCRKFSGALRLGELAVDVRATNVVHPHERIIHAVLAAFAGRELRIGRDRMQESELRLPERVEVGGPWR